MKRVTLKDISRECGFAVSTVSNILNDQKDCYASEEVKALVKATAERLNYHKDYLSVSLRTKKTYSVGLCVDRVLDETRSDFIRGFTQGCNNGGYEVALMDHRFEPRRLLENIHFFEQRYKDGMVIFTDFFEPLKDEESRLLKETLSRIKIPVIGIGSAFQTCISSMDIDRSWVLDDVLERLTQYRREEILIVYKNDFDFRRGDNGIRELGTQILEHIWTPQDFIQGWESLPHRHTIRAVFFRTDAIAIPAMKYFKSKGIHVPSDLEVISFDNFRFSEYTDPPLTTYDLNFNKLGQYACQTLIALMGETSHSVRELQLIRPHFIGRDSHRETRE
ncbi:MAG TPA: LacI family DNA-binding transcriptional regulator [Treponemataceae bacterium]|nr:LacI family DNA-binding transcriptional regulator [Treponemataceae bacterium]